MPDSNQDKKSVHDFWNEASCGESFYLPHDDLDGYKAQSKARYDLEGDFIFELAKFSTAKGKKVLEIGVGLGADHQNFAEAGADLYGIDLTNRAIDHTKKRFKVFGLESKLNIGDAENLDFPDDYFDIVYSWGVIHHSPDTKKAVSEIYRVLRKGGIARIMIYHKWSIVGFMLWLRYALLGFKPWMNLKRLYAEYLESSGTKAFSIIEAKELFKSFNGINIRTVLTHGDLLTSSAGQRHRGLFLNVARKIWPRWLIRRFLSKYGLFMLIELKK